MRYGYVFMYKVAELREISCIGGRRLNWTSPQLCLRRSCYYSHYNPSGPHNVSMSPLALYISGAMSWRDADERRAPKGGAIELAPLTLQVLDKNLSGCISASDPAFTADREDKIVGERRGREMWRKRGRKLFSIMDFCFSRTSGGLETQGSEREQLKMSCF